MFLIFIVSALSIHSFLVHNDPFYIFSEQEKMKVIEELSQDVHDKKNVNMKTISNYKAGEISNVVDNSQENDLDFSENPSNIDKLIDEKLGDEYEEIIFEDNFDKEYWEGTEDNYLEE